MEDSQSVKQIQKANCDNPNVNINGASLRQLQNQGVGSAVAEALTGQSDELTPEEPFYALNGNGDAANSDPLLNIHRNIVNVCLNDNENFLSPTTFTGNTQTGIETSTSGWAAATE